MTTYSYDDNPPLHSVRAERIPHASWVLAGIEPLPPGWLNVRLWSYDQVLGRDLYTTDSCPGVLHFESATTEVVIADADPSGSLLTENGDLWDDRPVVVATHIADPPHRIKQFADSTWQPAYVAGGYLGSCPADLVTELLAEHGFAEAIPRPPGDDSDGTRWPPC